MIKSGKYCEYQGCIHIHTSESDGTKSTDEVTEIASQTNLDFILISDHMTLDSRKAGKERFYKDTLVLIGYEHNDIEDINHYLLFGTEDVLDAKLTPREYVAEGARQNALGIIAHPDEIRSRQGRYPSYPWLEWDADGYDAIEIWNQMSEWMENLNWINWGRMLFSPRKSLESPTNRILKKWDSLNKGKKKIAGLGAIDVHAHPYRFGPLRITIFPYKVQFKSLRTHLLLPEEISRDIAIAQKQIVKAIRDCRVFVSNYRWGDASGFEFGARSGANEIICGGSLDSFEDSIIYTHTPAPAQIKLIGNGQRLAETYGNSLEYKPNKNGLYRVEVYKNGKGWIFSNHIRIGI
ncbi:MAG: histidinol-phosphatase [candidate division Zixibacteria bacterium]|nr:histidinol-phosphatase [candidate division Zixibacteria bacterium]